jgi:hypothetical protein
MFCPQCGSPVGDADLFCPNCGNPIAAAQAPEPAPVQEPVVQPLWKPDPEAYQQPPYPQQDYQQAFQQPAQPPEQQFGGVPVAAKKRSGKPWIFVGLGCLLVAALAVGAWWFLGRSKGDQPLPTLTKSAEQSLSSLSTYAEELPNLYAITQALEDMEDTEAMRIGVEFLSEYAYNYNGRNQTFGMGFQLDANLDQAAGKALINGSYKTDGVEIPFSFYLDRDQLQAASSALLDADEALVLPLRDLPGQWNESALSKLTGLTLPEDFDLDSLGDLLEFDSEEALEAAYGEDWIKFRDSVQEVVIEGDSRFTGNGTAYTLTWDRELLASMAEKTDVDMEDVFDVDDLDDLRKLDLKDVTAQVAVSALGYLNEGITGVQYYVENDHLTALYLETVDNAWFELRLTGENNPWEHLTATIHEDYDSYTTDDVLDVTVTIGSGQLRAEVLSSHIDSDGDEYSYTEGPYVLTYNDADGKITIEENGRDMADGADIRLVPVDGGLKFTAIVEYTGEGYSSKTAESLTLSTKIDPVKVLSSDPINLLKLSENELQALFLRIQKKASAFFGSVGN